MRSLTISTPGIYTFTPAAGETAVVADIIGGGAGGGGTQSNGSRGNAGPGGGSAEMVEGKLIPITTGSLTIIVGAAGTAGASAGFGTDGGLSSVGSIIALGGRVTGTTTGGRGGGVNGGVGTNVGNPGVPTSGTRETVREFAGDGGGGGGNRLAGTESGGGLAPGSATTSTGGTNGGGGGGGSSPYGPGANGGDDAGHTTGYDATNAGTGGGGGAGNANVAGGAGAPGRVTIYTGKDGTLAFAGTAWNPLDKNAAITLSNSNRTAVISVGNLGIVRGTSFHAVTGKYYFEVLATAVDTGNNDPMVGVGSASALLSGKLNQAGYWGIQSSPQFYYFNGSNAASGISFANGDVYQVAVDLATGKIWFGKNNVWILAGNPAAGTNPAASNVTGTVYPALALSSGCNTTANFLLGDFVYAPPSGFSAW